MLVTVYERRLHLVTQGSGDVTVLLDGAAGAGTLAWSAVAAELAATTRVIRYDRGGYGWSDAPPAPPTADDSAQDLRAALENRGAAGPYLLVGHDYGASIMRRFAHRYRREVMGLVLIDARPPLYAELAPRSWRKRAGRDRTALARDAMLARLGLGSRSEPGLAAALHARAVVARHGEAARLVESDREVAALPHLGDLPLIVLSHALPQRAAGLPGRDAERAAALWRRQQAELARSSGAGRHWEIEGAGDDMPSQRPDVIVRAVRTVLAMCVT